MKLWRKIAMKEGKKDGRRPGRAIKRTTQLEEMMFGKMYRTYPLLNALMLNAGIIKPTAPAVQKEQTDEAV